MKDNVLILEKDDVSSIKIYEGQKTYYRIALNKMYKTPKSKLTNVAKKLLMHPKEVIQEIKAIEMLYEIKEILDDQIRDIQYENYIQEQQRSKKND